jgi:hypothetical protein
VGLEKRLETMLRGFERKPVQIELISHHGAM